MFARQLLLLTAAIFSIVLYFSIGANHDWLHERILNFNTDIDEELDNLDYESRRRSRWDAPYLFSITVKQFLDSTHAQNPLLLTPPASYLRARGVDYTIPEPIVFFYYTGLYSVDIQSRNRYKAKFGIVAGNGKVAVKELKTGQEVEQLLNEYNHP